MPGNYKFGEYLKNLRNGKELTLKELDAKTKALDPENIGVSFSTISRLEDAKQDPTPDMLKKLAPALDIAYEEMMVAAGHLSDKVAEAASIYCVNESGNASLIELIGIAQQLSNEQRTKLINMAKAMYPEIIK